MAHTRRYAFRGISKLALDSGVSRSSISRIIHGKMNPSFAMVARLTRALEKELKRTIDPRDLLTELGDFLTPFTCDLTGCTGCLPENAHDEFGQRKQAFDGIRPGQWVSSRHPSGYQAGFTPGGVVEGGE